jgi:alkyl hydroperoxide reductase subunit AhpF
VLGEHGVEAVKIKNVKTNEETVVPTHGLFVAIGHKPNTELFKGKIEMDEAGYIHQLDHTQTNVPGVFAAGDVSDHRYRQAVTAAGDGCRAALDAEEFLTGDVALDWGTAQDGALLQIVQADAMALYVEELILDDVTRGVIARDPVSA